MRLFQDIVWDQRVAVVGNAMSLMHAIEPRAKTIDGFDVVLRMNAGIPGVLEPRYVGSKTNIWATAKHFGNLNPRNADLMVFMKLTSLGDKHWDQFQREKAMRPYPMIRWTQKLEDEVKAFVGADPGTGIRMLYYLKKYCAPKAVVPFGMDCWRTVSSWSNKPNTPNHKPDLELEAMQQLLSE